jgi:GLPGLI family protein
MNTLKKTLFVFVILSMVNCFGQSASGQVVYKIQLVGFGADSKNLEYKELNETINEIANKQTCTLTFNSTQSSSVLSKYLVSDSNNNRIRNMAEKIAFVEINLFNYYLDKSKNSVLLESLNGNLIEKKPEKLEWEITTESKQIGDYLCYKAIYLMKFVNRKGVNTSIPITAWFAPSLPYSYGPKYLNGLPGLILMLEDRETTFIASSITISKDKEFKIDFPKGKTITEENYNKKNTTY